VAEDPPSVRLTHYRSRHSGAGVSHARPDDAARHERNTMSSQRITARRTAAGVVLAGLAALSLAACGSAASSTEAGASGGSSQSVSAEASWPRTVSTDDGELTLKEQPQRIVSTSTTLTGALLAIDAPVVASAATSPNIDGLSDANGFFSQWSSQAKAAGVEKLYENASPNLEKVAEYEPDLIVVAKNSGDSVMDSVDQLRKISDVLVVDYSGSSWEDVTTMVAKATGHEKEAEGKIADFNAHLQEAKSKIAVPEGDTSALIVFGDGSGAAALTEEASQVQIMNELGFQMATIPDSVKGDTSMGADRKDIVNLSMENVQKGLTGQNWIVVSADDKAKAQIKDDKAFNTAPAVKAGKVAYTPGETFRLDYYSAIMLVDSLVESFGK
jgi:ferric enterobactin transport system substrate-binding protein